MTFDLILRGGVVDGTGADAFCADVGVVGDRIAAIGDLSDAEAKRVIDVSGRYVVPGFIDPHSHADLSVLFEPPMTNYLMQGVTTVVVGNCGHSYAPVGDDLYRAAIIDSRVQFAANPSYFQMTQLLFPKEAGAKALREEYGVEMDWRSFAEYTDRCNAKPMDGNIAPLAGYSAIRGTVMGQDCLREATEAELDVLERLTRECMEQGAFADIVVLDWAHLHSHDMDEDVLQYPEGIDYVIVNGALTIDHKTHTGAAAGRMLRRDER